MAYTSISDLEKEFSNQDLARLSGDPSGTVVNTARLNHIISKADAVVSAYLVGRYPQQGILPITPVINFIATELAVVFLFENAFAKRIIPQTILLRRVQAYEFLKEYTDGKISLMEIESLNKSAAYLTNNNINKRDFNDEDFK